MEGRIRTKTNKIIASEWDNIAQYRAKQLLNHEDITMDYVLIPYVIDKMKDANLTNVLDIGCGTGYTSCKVGQEAKKLTGIDISGSSIKIAKENSYQMSNFSFAKVSIEDFSKNNSERYTLAIANMTFMDVVDLENAIICTSDLLIENSFLIITVTHPYFWPLYWGYANEKWFNYSEEIEIEGNFDISLNKSSFITTHYHRPLEMYFNVLSKNKLEIIELSELIPSKNIMTKYPTKWEYPRFLGLKCRKRR